MKKQYIQPSIEVHKIETMGMLAQSLRGSTPGKGYTSTDVSYAHDFDFDEDEEDY